LLGGFRGTQVLSRGKRGGRGIQNDEGGRHKPCVSFPGDVRKPGLGDKGLGKNQQKAKNSTVGGRGQHFWDCGIGRKEGGFKGRVWWKMRGELEGE